MVRYVKSVPLFSNSRLGPLDSSSSSSSSDGSDVVKKKKEQKQEKLVVKAKKAPSPCQLI